MNDLDRLSRNLDSEEQFRYLILESPYSEDLFAKRYFDLELEPYEIFSMKLLMGRFHTEAEIYKFIEEHGLEFIYETGSISHGGEPGISPAYFSVPSVLVLWPAGFGKTTVVDNIIPVMSACDNPNARLQFILKDKSEANSVSTGIRQRLEQPDIVADFGEFKPDDKVVPWSYDRFSVRQRQWRDKEENFSFYGCNSTAETGKRSDHVYIDDIELADTVRTVEERAKTLEWVGNGPLTSARPMWPKDGNGKVLIPSGIRWSKVSRYWGTGVVGTIFHPQGLYAMLMRNPNFTSVRISCWRDREKTKSLSDKMMSAKELDAKRKEIGYLSFMKRFENIAYNESEMAFRESWVRGGEELYGGEVIQHPGCIDRDISFGEVPDGWDTYLGFDPASGSRSKWSAEAAYVVLAVDPNKDDPDLYLVDYDLVQDNFDRMLDRLLVGNLSYGIKGFYDIYNYRLGVVEKNGFGKWMVNNDRIAPYIRAGTIVESWTGENKADPEAGVFSMGRLVQDGRFHIPYQKPSDRERAEEYIGHLLMYPKGTCDLVMATWLAQLKIRRNHTEHRSWFVAGGSGKYYRVPKPGM